MLCKTVILKHVLDAQIFEYYSVSRVYKFPRYLMQELLAKVGYSLCDPGQLILGFLPVIGTRLLAMQRFIGSSILLLNLNVVLWIVEVLTIRSYGCMSDAKEGFEKPINNIKLIDKFIYYYYHNIQYEDAH
jgi:hypothetical protein